jgi:aspartate racemase
MQMKTIGIIGGLTWYSTVEYYKLLNELVNERLGGAHAAKIILHSVDFAEIKVLTEQQDWKSIAEIICKVAKGVELAGADCLLIGANTMHNIADEVEAAINIPLLHIAEATAAVIKNKGLKKVALLGTKYTMQMDFYKLKLAAKNIETIIPGATDIEFINNSIYSEFSKGIFLPETKQQYLRIIEGLIQQGAEGFILGCTEIPILIKQEDCRVPVFDTGLIHATAAVDFALG